MACMTGKKDIKVIYNQIIIRFIKADAPQRDAEVILSKFYLKRQYKTLDDLNCYK